MYFTMKEAIELTGLKRSTLINLCNREKLKYIQLENGYRIIEKESIIALISWQTEYKPIPNFENYTISKSGEIRKVTGKYAPMIMKPKLDKDGYYQIGLYKDGKKYYKSIHRLVAITYIENTCNFSDVNHKDGDRTNNNVENLEWCTQRYNTMHSYVCNNRKANITTNKKCELYKNNEKLGEFNSIQDAVRYYSTLEEKGMSSLISNKKYKDYTIKVISND